MPSPKTQNPRTRTKSADKSAETAAASHPEWDRKHGMPKDAGARRLVERATDRYSASGQSEDTKKAKARRP